MGSAREVVAAEEEVLGAARLTALAFRLRDHEALLDALPHLLRAVAALERAEAETEAETAVNGCSS